MCPALSGRGASGGCPQQGDEGVGTGVEEVVVAEGAQGHVVGTAGGQGQTPGLLALGEMQGILLAGELLDAGLGVVGGDLAAYDLAAAAAREQGDAVRVPRQSREKGSGTVIDWRRFSTPRSVRSPVRGGVTARRTGGLGLDRLKGLSRMGMFFPGCVGTATTPSSPIARGR